MQITKNQLKTLRYIKKKKIVTYSQLNSKFNDLDWISPYVYITDHREDDADSYMGQLGYTREQDENEIVAK